MNKNEIHIPVLCKEVIEYLDPRPSQTILDCTVGFGGHAQNILEYLNGKCSYIGIDQDEQALAYSRTRLKAYESSVYLRKANFRDVGLILDQNNITKVDAVLFDLGISSLHVDSGDRGFSFYKQGPLDMRMDRDQDLTAKQVVNTFSYEDLEKIIREYGQERYSRRIARAIVQTRKIRKYETTQDLVKTILDNVKTSRARSKVHPATRTFQALRICVNDELNALSQGLVSIGQRVNERGRIVMISFHSLEDRIVKNTFRDWGNQHLYEILTKKPVTAEEDEIKANPRARSAKLRAAKKCGM